MKTYNLLSAEKKALIVKEYLYGNVGYSTLAKKYDVSITSIHKWVRKSIHSKVENPSKPIESIHISGQEEPLSTDVNELQKQLKAALLENELLNAMIDIAKEQLKIDIRKKSGSKQ